MNWKVQSNRGHNKKRQPTLNARLLWALGAFWMDSVDKAIVKQHLKVNFSVFALLVAALLLRFNFQISSSQIGKGEFLFAVIITFSVSLLFSLLYMGFKHGVTISKLSPSCMVIRKDEKFSFQLSITTSFLFFVFMGGIWISMFFFGFT